jgi:hypothetical protein
MMAVPSVAMLLMGVAVVSSDVGAGIGLESLTATSAAEPDLTSLVADPVRRFRSDLHSANRIVVLFRLPWSSCPQDAAGPRLHYTPQPSSQSAGAVMPHGHQEFDGAPLGFASFELRAIGPSLAFMMH